MELNLLLAIQSVANPFLDALFIGLTIFGEPLAAVAVLTIVYWLCDKETGEYMAFSLLASLGVNGLVKNLCNFPRPIGQPGVRSLRVETATGASFPSGHTQTAATLYGSAALRSRRVWAGTLAVVLVVLVGFSRLYLGVHWPKDVLMGLALGAGVAVGGYILFSNLNEQGREVLFLITAVVFLPLVLLWGDHDFVMSYGLLAGFAVAVPLEHRFVRFSTENLTKRRKLLRELLGLALLGAVKVGLGFVFPGELLFVGIEYGLVGFTAFFLCPLVFKKLQV